MERPVGIVLAGGRGRRMGGPKGTVTLRGEPLAQRAARALEPWCERVLVSVAPGAESPVSGWDIVRDPPPTGRGPLAGILAAFDRVEDAPLLVLACDYPLVVEEVVRGLAEAEALRCDLVLLADAVGRDHPLVARWERTAMEEVRESLSRGECRVRSVVARLAVRRLRAVDFPGVDLESALTNVNRPEDLARLRKR